MDPTRTSLTVSVVLLTSPPANPFGAISALSWHRSLSAHFDHFESAPASPSHAVSNIILLNQIPPALFGAKGAFSLSSEY